MPEISKIARFVSAQRPGCGTFSLLGCKGTQDLGEDCKSKLSVLVVRSQTEEPLADWHSPNADKFLNIEPEKAQQRGQDFEFTVGPEVVNPMAYDNNLGDFTLKIKCADGVIRSYKISVQDPQLRPSTSYVSPQNENQEFKATEPKTAEEGAASVAGATDAGAANAAKPLSAAQQRAANAEKTQSKLRMGTSLVRIFGIVGIILVLGLLFFFLRDSFLGKEDPVAKPLVAEANKDQANQANKAESKDPQANDHGELGEGNDIDSAEHSAIKADVSTNVNVGEVIDGNVDTKGANNQSSTNLVTNNKSSNTLIASQACRIVNGLDDRTIINNCLAAQPTDTHLMQLLIEALKNERCEIALRLLRSKGRASNGGIYAHVYATFADPQSVYRSPCIVKSAEDAAYWSKRAQADQSLTPDVAQKLLENFRAYHGQ